MGGRSRSLAVCVLLSLVALLAACEREPPSDSALDGSTAPAGQVEPPRDVGASDAPGTPLKIPPPGTPVEVLPDRCLRIATTRCESIDLEGCAEALACHCLEAADQASGCSEKYTLFWQTWAAQRRTE